MREPSFLVLAALAEQPQHGYGLIDDIQRMSEGRVRLRAGTLYAILDRLRDDGVVEVDREEIVQSRLRRYYRLTGSGEQRLASETERLRRNAAIGAERLQARKSLFGNNLATGGAA